MSDPVIEPTASACCFGTLMNLAAEINAGWKQRWKQETPGFCFRGVDDESFDLNPSLLRSPYPTALEELARLENGLWAEFRLRSKPLLGYQVANAWAALFIMQQFGLPTRLLDWSRSLAVAAYFAARDLDTGTDGAVWIMAARHLMETRGINDSWRTIVGHHVADAMGPRDGTGDLQEFNALHPVAISPDQLVPRIIAQRGIYTIHAFRRHTLESLGANDRLKHGGCCFLHKIVIPRKSKLGLRQELSVVAGISEESLFPDLEGFARDFVAEHKWRHEGDQLGRRQERPPDGSAG